MKNSIIALPGFLGLASDWNSLPFKGIVGFNANSFDWNNLWDWGKKFNQIMQANGSQNILMGYSMGGRFGLHALIDNPHLWKAAIIVSTHPGLASEKEKLDRIETDKMWGMRFLHEPWIHLMKDWNDQNVFSKQFDFIRNENNYNRIELKEILEKGSLGKQDNLSNQISKLPIPILWVTGELDTKYTKLSETIHFSHEKSKKKVIPGTGHRIPWEQRENFIATLNEFLISVLTRN